MHASIEQLLRLRDGEDVGGPVGAHVRECTRCHLELTHVTTVTAALRDLPAHSAPPDGWNAIKARWSGAATSQVAPPSRPGWLLPAASAAVVLVAVLLTFGDGDRSDRTGEVDTRETGISPVDESRRQLVAESQRLESLLAALPAEPRLTRAHTALTVADLEDRIQWVDYRLNLASEAGLGRDQAARLWRERVDLLNSLVAVRYAQARTLAF